MGLAISLMLARLADQAAAAQVASLQHQLFRQVDRQIEALEAAAEARCRRAATAAQAL